MAMATQTESTYIFESTIDIITKFPTVILRFLSTVHKIEESVSRTENDRLNQKY